MSQPSARSPSPPPRSSSSPPPPAWMATCAATPPNPRKSSATWESKFRAIPEPARMREALRRTLGAPTPRRFPATTRTTPSGCATSSSRTAGTRLSRSSRSSSRRPRSGCWRWSPRRSSPRSLEEPAVAAGSDERPEERTASIVQRVFGRRRRDRAPRVRELRRPRRLRRARTARDLREGRDRHRALRRIVARHQAEGRLRARRRGMPHLFRPEGRRLLAGRGISQRSVPAEGRRAAGQRDGHARLSRRSAHARRGRDEGRGAPRPEGRHHDHEDPGAPDFVRRRAAAARGDDRAGRARGDGAARCRSLTAWVPDPRACTSSSRSTGASSRCTT